MKQTLQGQASVWKDRCQRVAELIYPSKANITFTRNTGAGVDRDVTLCDSTAIVSRRILAHAIHSTVFNPSVRWLRLKVRGLKDAGKESKAWLQRYEALFLDTLAETNYYPEALEMCNDYVTFGPGVLEILEKFDRSLGRFVPVFRARDPRGYLYAENYYGVVDEIFHTQKMSVKQILERFPKAEQSEKIQDKVKQDKYYDEMNVVHYCGPKRESDESGKPYVAFYYLEEDKAFGYLNDGEGYDYFPFLVPRFEPQSDSPYANSPGMDAYPTVRSLNDAVYLLLESYEKTVNPPSKVSKGNLPEPLNSLPAGITEMIDINEHAVIGENYRLDGADMIINNLRRMIEKIFYIDQIQFPSLQDKNTYMKATEVTARVNINQWIMSPSYTRMTIEHHKPLIDALDVFFRKYGYFDIIGEPPEEIQGRYFDIEMVGPMRAAQDAQRAQANEYVLNTVVQLAQAPEEAVPELDRWAYLMEVVETTGANQNIIRSKEDIDRIKQQMREMQQAQAMVEMASTGADAYKKAREASAIG
jgi:hypothetical protein